MSAVLCARNAHAEQVSGWEGSHHALAMQTATPDTVLGDFDNATFRHDDVTLPVLRP